MPRKQRFKPSRKPKAIGTPTDLAPLPAEVEARDSTRSREVTPAVIEPDVRHHEPAAFSSAPELRGESS